MAGRRSALMAGERTGSAARPGAAGEWHGALQGETAMKSGTRGFALIELLGALALGSLMLAGLSVIIDNTLEDAKGQQAAHYQAQIVDAATKYIKANYSTLAVVANTTATATVSLTDLINASILPASFGPANAYGQTPCVLVRATSKVVSGQTVYMVNALIVTEGTAAQAIPDRLLHAVAAQSGVGGGAVSAQTPTVASGSYGGWTLDGSTSPTLANFLSARCSANTAGGGSLASALFYDGPGQLATDFLYRNAVTGHQELNQMNTPLKMSASAVVTENDACGANAAIAVDAARNLMNCDVSGVWKRVTTWKLPVASYNDLPGVVTAATDQVGDVRMTLDTSRAFMYAGGASWNPLGVDQAGNLLVPGSMSAGTDVNAGNNLIAGNNVNVGHDVNLGNSVNAGNNVNASHDLYAANNIVAEHDVTAHNDMHAVNDINAGNNLTVTRNTHIGGKATVLENAYIGVSVYTNGDVNAGGNVNSSTGPWGP